MQARDSGVPGASHCLFSPQQGGRRQWARPRMLSTGPRAQTCSQQTESRYQRLEAKATTRPGSPGRALDKSELPRLATLNLPNSHGTFPLQKETTGRPWCGQEWGCWTLRFHPHLLCPCPSGLVASGSCLLRTAFQTETATCAQGRLCLGLAECLPGLCSSGSSTRCALRRLPGTCVKLSLRIHCSHTTAPMLDPPPRGL